MRYLLLLCCVAGVAAAQSDVELEGDALARFQKTKGASHAGRDVRWDVPAKAFALPLRVAGGYALYVHQGVGILVDEGSSGLAEVRRRGGIAVVRGRVTALTAKEKRPGEPGHVVFVKSLTYRRQSRTKK